MLCDLRSKGRMLWGLEVVRVELLWEDALGSKGRMLVM